MSKSPLSVPMDRRRFLSTTAVGVAGLALTNKVALAAPATLAAGTPPLISIGFAAALPANGTQVRLADATSILMPDPSFLSHDARVTVAGSARGPKHVSDPGGLAVDAVMSRRFRFWSAAANGTSGALSFTVPVTASTGGIDFIARRMKTTSRKEEIAATAPADVDPAPFTLSLGSADGPKLQRGVYVVALRESSSEIITDWSRFTIAANDGAYTIPGAEFGWVLLKIDYAK